MIRLRNGNITDVELEMIVDFYLKDYYGDSYFRFKDTKEFIEYYNEIKSDLKKGKFIVYDVGSKKVFIVHIDIKPPVVYNDGENIYYEKNVVEYLIDFHCNTLVLQSEVDRNWNAIDCRRDYKRLLLEKQDNA